MVAVLTQPIIQARRSPAGARALIRHPNADAEIFLLVDAGGVSHISSSGSLRLRLPAVAELLAEWFPGGHGPIQGQTNGPRAVRQTGVRHVATICCQGHLAYITVDNRQVLLHRPNPELTGALYLTTAIGPAELAEQLVVWYGEG